VAVEPGDLGRREALSDVALDDQRADPRTVPAVAEELVAGTGPGASDLGGEPAGRLDAAEEDVDARSFPTLIQTGQRRRVDQAHSQADGMVVDLGWLVCRLRKEHSERQALVTNHIGLQNAGGATGGH
jgi:hypothetical protein